MNADVNSATISYEDSKQLAGHQDAGVRAKLARRNDIAPEVLYFLAEDTDPEVRRAVAENAASPGLSHVLLAGDDDTEVRRELASNIATKAPGLDASEADKSKRATYQALDILARDQLTVVRGVLSEALKDVPGAPHDIIKTLAHDLEIEVCGPVLEHSPVLGDEDLLEVLSQPSAEGAINAVARRENLREVVSDAVVASENEVAIGELLGNNSAQIREETLDQLVNTAAGVELWHKPLVARSQLPDGAAARMAQYLADNLLAELGQRTDLDETTLAEVRETVAQRIGGRRKGGNPREGAGNSGQDFLNADLPMDMVMRLYNARKLEAKVVEKALLASDYSFVFASLLIRAGVGREVGRRIFQEKHPKAITAMCWKAGLSAEMAEQVQKLMGRLPPNQVLMANEDGSYFLNDQDLAWQLEFFADLTAAAR